MSNRTIPIVPAGDESPAESFSLHFPDYLRLHLGFYRCLLIQITLRCPLECAHCCVDAGPSRREKLDEDRLEVGIRSFAALSSAKLVCLTGGEPFSAKSLLRKSLSLCETLGLQSYVITAAHWATSVERARTVLTALPPITLLSVSADRYHEEFVPLVNIRNALEAANELRISANLLLTTDDDGGDFEARLASELADLWGGLAIHRTPLGEVGRSSSHSHRDGDINSSDDGPCPLIGTPAVTADGSVCACCQVQETNLMAQPGHALNLGRLGVDPFSTMQQKLYSDPLLQAIRLAGPKWIIRRAQANAIMPAVPLDELSVCQACSLTVRDSRLASALREMLRSPAAALQMHYLESMNHET